MSVDVFETQIMPAFRVRGGVPDWGTAFIGREKLLGRLDGLAPGKRIVTLVGPPGVGKTRLAHQFALRQQRVVWVEAWKVLTEPMLPYAVSQALQAQTFEDGRLVLDGCDRWPAATRAVVEQVSASYPKVSFLLTSREPVIESATVEVTPFEALKGSADTPEALLRNESGRLLLDRLRTWAPQLKLKKETAPRAADICRLAEGNALALELAASRFDSAGLDLLRERLAGDDRRKRRVGESPLAIILELIYEGMSEFEAVIYRQLGVFAGSCRPIDSALVATGQSTAEAIALVAGLGQHTALLQIREDGRITVPQYIWEDARGRLFRAKEERAAEARHAHVFGTLAAQADRKLTGPQAKTWVRILQSERENLRSAVAWMLDQEPDGALETVANLALFWYAEANVKEGQELIAMALNASERRDAIRTKAEEGAARLASRQQDYSFA